MANTQEQNDAGSVYWTPNGAPSGETYTQTRQIIYPQTEQPSTYWAEYWNYSGDPSGLGGYMGLQTDSALGSGGKEALFSSWYGTGWSNATGDCQMFTESGVTGVQCWAPLNFVTTDDYQYDLVKVGSDGNKGYWWQAEIQDLSTGINTPLGEIAVLSSQDPISIETPQNFSEYFGAPFTCNESPVSDIQWTPPLLNWGSTAYGSLYGSESYRGDPCSNFVVTQGSYGQQPYTDAQLGGPS